MATAMLVYLRGSRERWLPASEQADGTRRALERSFHRTPEEARARACALLAAEHTTSA